MSKTQTETIETVYGAVELELVECDSCGNRVKQENAEEFTLGDREGWACDTCTGMDDGPVTWPEHSVEKLPDATAAALLIGLWPIAVVAGMILLLSGDESESDVGVLMLSLCVGGVVWTCAILFFTNRLVLGGVLP